MKHRAESAKRAPTPALAGRLQWAPTPSAPKCTWWGGERHQSAPTPPSAEQHPTLVLGPPEPPETPLKGVPTRALQRTLAPCARPCPLYQLLLSATTQAKPILGGGAGQDPPGKCAPPSSLSLSLCVPLTERLAIAGAGAVVGALSPYSYSSSSSDTHICL